MAINDAGPQRRSGESQAEDRRDHDARPSSDQPTPPHGWFQPSEGGQHKAGRKHRGEGEQPTYPRKRPEMCLN